MPDRPNTRLPGAYAKGGSLFALSRQKIQQLQIDRNKKGGRNLLIIVSVKYSIFIFVKLRIDIKNQRE